MASKVLLQMSESANMEIRNEFFRLVSAVIGLSVGVAVTTATLLLGVAALLD